MLKPDTMARIEKNVTDWLATDWPNKTLAELTDDVIFRWGPEIIKALFSIQNRFAIDGHDLREYFYQKKWPIGVTADYVRPLNVADN